MKDVAALLSACAAIVGVLVWPALILVVVLKFSDSLRNFLSNLSEFDIKAAGVEASARRQQLEAAVNIGAALSKTGATTDDAATTSAAAQQLADTLPDARRQQELRASLVLWVDDRPQNNVFERQALTALGIRIALALSTDEALVAIERQPVDLVISDMGRPPDAHAGYTLLDELRRRGNTVPFIIYAGSRSPELVREAQAHGAVGSTNSPQELIALVTTTLQTPGR
jgi:CheY-like chemotaxis protein